MNKNQIKTAVDIFKKGGIVIFPTDTAFGIGCRIDNEKAVEKLFRIRKRPLSQAVPVLVSSIEMAQKYLLSIPEEVKIKLIEKYWPGALTIILPCKKELVPKLVRGGGETLGVRIPNNDLILKIIEEIGMPILGPSANFSKGKTPFSFEDLDPVLIKLADYVIFGKTQEKKTSTLIDCSKKPWKILREGTLRI